MRHLSTTVALAGAVLGAIAGPAASQEINPLVRERILIAPSQSSPLSQPDRRLVRVQVGINFFMPGPTGDGEEATKVRERARLAVYEMAGRECGLLQDIIAAECRLESVTVNVTRQACRWSNLANSTASRLVGRWAFRSR
jgi:hypothetical protein